MSAQQQMDRPRIVAGAMNYAIDHGGVIRFHARNSALDTFAHEARTMDVIDARTLADPPTLDREGFALMRLPTAIEDFRDQGRVLAEHPAEIIAFIRGLTGADEVVLAGPGALRFGERAGAYDREKHSKVARLVHSDTSIAGSEAFNAQYDPHPERRVARTVHHNIWRTFSPPPQDLPLALCDFRSVRPEDLVIADAAFDNDQGEVTWSFEALLFAYNPAHRWHFWPNMSRDEVLVFKRYDSDRTQPWFVPHTAFEDQAAGPEAVPRASIEMRTISYWYE